MADRSRAELEDRGTERCEASSETCAAAPAELGAEQAWSPPLAGLALGGSLAGLAVGGSPVRRSAQPQDVLGGQPVSAATLDSLRRAASSGSRLPRTVEGDMAAAFGQDLSILRMHDDAQSHQLAESMQARAFTYGRDIYFGRGQYAPHSSAGQHLLAHELSHAVSPVQGSNSGVVIGRADDPAERQADAHADRVVAALRRRAVTSAEPGGASAERTADPQPGGVVAALRRQAAARSEGDHASEAGMPSDGVIRRAVGFEFQCRKWKVHDTAGEVVKSNKGKEQRLYPEAEPDGWYLMSDGGDPEFVVEHVETDNAELLGKRLGKVAAFADGMAKSRLDKQRIRTKTKHNKVHMVDLVAGDRPVTADPQITAGIALARIGELFSQLGQRKVTAKDAPDSEANKQLMRNKQVKHYTGDDLLLERARVAIHTELQAGFITRFLADEGIKANSTAWDEVLGVLALLVSYLMKAPELGHAYIKDFPLLAKTDLGTAISKSPLMRGTKKPVTDLDPITGAEVDPGTREWPEANLEQIVRAVMRASGRTNGDELVYAEDPTGDASEDGPTVRAWLDGVIKRQHDLLSYRKNRDFADDSMGNLGKVDTVGRGSKSAAPILELRRVNETLPYDQWVDFGERIRVWLDQLNDLDQMPDDLKG